jgi:hypothetical protein
MERLNILCAFFASGQVASCLFLIICWTSSRLVERQLDDSFVVVPADEALENDGEGSSTMELVVSIWNTNGSILLLGVLAVLVFIASVVTIPIIRSVNLLGAIRYLWALLWITPFEASTLLVPFKFSGSIVQIFLSYICPLVQSIPFSPSLPDLLCDWVV